MNPFDAMYDGTPPWEIGRPQEPFVRLALAGRIGERVLDVGCGTGDLVCFLARRGHEAWGLDASRKAIVRAKAKAAEERVRASFLLGDALALRRLRRSFDTIVDSGLFHTFGDDARALYVRNLESALVRGGTFHLLCFSDAEPDWGGPRRVSKGELLETFQGGWWIESITEARFHNRVSEDGARAWLASMSWEGRPLPGIH